MSGDEPSHVIKKVFSKMYNDTKRLKFYAGVLDWVIGAAAVVVILFPEVIDIIFRLD